MNNRVRKSGLTLIQEEEIKISPEFGVLAANERPPQVVMLWIVQMLARKMQVQYAYIHNFIVSELYEKE